MTTLDEVMAREALAEVRKVEWKVTWRHPISGKFKTLYGDEEYVREIARTKADQRPVIESRMILVTHWRPEAK